VRYSLRFRFAGHMVKSKPNNRAKGARRARRNSRKNVQQKNQNSAMSKQMSGVGAVTNFRMPRIGLRDLMCHRISWIAGYTFVGDGTRGTANNVFFSDAAGTYLFGGLTGTVGTSGVGGGVPILAADSKVGATYIADVEKHYARKVIRKQWMHVITLQPSTSNNMVAYVCGVRGPSAAEQGVALPKATSTAVQQTLTNVLSMDNRLEVRSYESKTMDITHLIAGGSGALQNEFEIDSPTDASTTVIQSSNVPGIDLIGVCPTSLIVSGNCTTTGLQNTNVHAIIVEQEVDFLDFIGGSSQISYVGAQAPAVEDTSSSSTKAAVGVLKTWDVSDDELARLRTLHDALRK